MLEREPFEVDQASLRDNAEEARVERIWRRLESNASGPVLVRRSWSLSWAPALAAGLVMGFLVGHQWQGTADEPVAGKLVAEPASLEPSGPPEPRQVANREGAEQQPKRTKPRRPHRHARARQVVPLEDSAESVEVNDVPVIDLAPPVAGPPPAPAQWLQLADRGEYWLAYHSLEENGGFDAVLDQASADELMILVDVARATGNRGRAIQALRRVTQSFVSDPNAPIAAMTLGRMLMQAGDKKGASEAFSLYRRLSPQGDFAEDALASDIQAAVEQGDWERAHTLAKQYESDFPDGRHLEQIREQLSAAPQADGSASGSEPRADEESEEKVDLPAPVESPYE